MVEVTKQDVARIHVRLDEINRDLGEKLIALSNTQIALMSELKATCPRCVETIEKHDDMLRGEDGLLVRVNRLEVRKPPTGPPLNIKALCTIIGTVATATAVIATAVATAMK